MKHIKTFESYISLTNESNTTLGAKAKKFDDIEDQWDWFTDANKGGEEELPKEWHDALKKLGIKDADAIVCFFDAVGSAEDVLNAANKSGLKYAEVEGGDGSGGIVFSARQ